MTASINPHSASARRNCKGRNCAALTAGCTTAHTRQCHNWQMVKPVNTGNFLDQIRRTINITAP